LLPSLMTSVSSAFLLMSPCKKATHPCPCGYFGDLTGTHSGEPSSAIRERVLAARGIQNERFAKSPAVRCNARMTSKLLKANCKIDDASIDLLRMAMHELNLSARAHDRILKVARTIADLEAAPDITATHLSEAIQYRTLDRNLWA